MECSNHEMPDDRPEGGIDAPPSTGTASATPPAASVGWAIVKRAAIVQNRRVVEPADSCPEVNGWLSS
jgi:hypothetical protein